VVVEDAAKIKGSTTQSASFFFWLEQQVGMHQTLFTSRSQAWEMGTENQKWRSVKAKKKPSARLKPVIGLGI
jgi:hypothetical protein